MKNSVCNVVDGPIVILVYHRVKDILSDPEMLAVSPAHFRQQLEYLKERFPVLRFDEDWSSAPKPGVVVTFDDGYADNVSEALPILEEMEVPATFFVSTGRLGTGEEFWWHELERILLREGELPSRFTLKDARFGGDWETASLGQRKKLYGLLNRLMQKVYADRQEEWLGQLRNWAGVSKEGDSLHRCMTLEEVNRLAASPWATVGAHTVTHSALAALSEGQQRREIFSSKEHLEGMLGREVTTFSYPFGRKRDYNRTSVRLCREAGFIKAASNFPGQVHRWTDPFQLPRHLVRNWDLETFAVEMERFWTR